MSDMSFASEMRECGLLHENDPCLSSPTLEVSLYNGHESSVPLELATLEKDVPLIFLPFLATSLSSTPRDTTIDVLTLLTSPLPLAYCTRIEIGESSRGESSRGDASFVKDDLLD